MKLIMHFNLPHKDMVNNHECCNSHLPIPNLSFVYFDVTNQHVFYKTVEPRSRFQTKFFLLIYVTDLRMVL